MKREYVMWLVVAVALIAVCLLGAPKGDVMGVSFSGADKLQYIQFPSPVAAENLTTITVAGWVNLTNFSNATFPYICGHFTSVSGLTTKGWYVRIDETVPEIVFYQKRATTSGLWGADITTGLHSFVISYDSTSTANNPIIYIDGSSVAVRRESAPDGAVVNWSGAYLSIGNENTSYYKSLKGSVLDLREYNRILSADEVAIIYSARGADNIRNGLVFCPFLLGARGLQAFDGVTLTADNTIIDPCSGALGVPAGSPVGAGETYLK